MNLSTWDLEVYAREMQRRRWREATRARQIEEACRGGHRPAPRFSVARLTSAARTWLSSRPAGADRGEAPVASEPGLLAMHVAESPANPGVRPSPLSQPYAGMVVLARGAAAQTAEQPCGVGDC